MTPFLRLLDRPRRDPRQPSPRCARCGKTTREGKPLCSDHVTELPYPAAVEAELARRDAVLERIAKRGVRAVDPADPVVQDIVRLMTYHGWTVARAARQFDVAADVIELVCRGVVRARPDLQLVPTGRRGGLVLGIRTGWGRDEAGAALAEPVPEDAEAVA